MFNFIDGFCSLWIFPVISVNKKAILHIFDIAFISLLNWFLVDSKNWSVGPFKAVDPAQPYCGAGRRHVISADVERATLADTRLFGRDFAGQIGVVSLEHSSWDENAKARFGGRQSRSDCCSLVRLHGDCMDRKGEDRQHANADGMRGLGEDRSQAAHDIGPFARGPAPCGPNRFAQSQGSQPRLLAVAGPLQAGVASRTSTFSIVPRNAGSIVSKSI